MDRLVLLMQADERVLEEPAPPSVIVVAATAAGVDLMLYCWVNNADWLKARSDLWLQIVDAFENDQRLQLSLPQQEVFVLQKDEPAP